MKNLFLFYFGVTSCIPGPDNGDIDVDKLAPTIFSKFF